MQRRLVEEYDPSRLSQGAGDQNFLLLAAAQRVELPVAQFNRRGSFQRVGNGEFVGDGFFAARAMGITAEGYQLACGQGKA